MVALRKVFAMVVLACTLAAFILPASAQLGVSGSSGLNPGYRSFKVQLYNNFPGGWASGMWPAWNKWGWVGWGDNWVKELLYGLPR